LVRIFENVLWFLYVLATTHKKVLLFTPILQSAATATTNIVYLHTGIPFVYHFEFGDGGRKANSNSNNKKMTMMTPTTPPNGSLTQRHCNGKFLGKPGLLQKAVDEHKEWKGSVPGLSSLLGEETSTSEAAAAAAAAGDTTHGGGAQKNRSKRRTANVADSLLMLRREQTHGQEEPTVDFFDEQVKLVLQSQASSSAATEDTFADPSEFEDFDSTVRDNSKEASVAANIVPLAVDGGSTQNENDGPVVVFIRHGRTPHNNLGLFTGWEDPPLAPDGVEDAKNAGRLLRRHGFKFDVVYSSWLQRAIQTAWYVLDELDAMHLPMIKSWRLNERMYGALTGKSKAMVANEYGEEQLIKWRRGFKIRPPPVSSYSLNYPGNDYSRTKYVKDLRISFSETFNRSWEERKFKIHRKFPKHESLHDCMQRSVRLLVDVNYTVCGLNIKLHRN
jgi:2,3-bisphosphoglycerate-dependent phosphoglycerate mutase